MSTGQTDPNRTGVTTGPTYVSRHFVVAGEELRQASGWLIFLGILLIILGTVALIAPLIATKALVLVYGWVLLIAGVTQIFSAFASLRWGGFFMHLLVGLIDLVLGVFFFRHQVAAASVLTLLLAAGFLVGGAFRLVAAFSLRFPGWGWTALSGFVTFIVGAYIWSLWDTWETLTIPGLFLGIQMLFYGWSAVALALAARK
jgi:uncharacterized membrane protein HdeD (DUF308 family)